MNNGIQQSFGYNTEEMIGKNFSLLFRREDQAKRLPEREITTVLQKGFSRDENYCVHKDGSSFWTLGESVFTKNEEGEIFIIKLIFDINQQKLLEEHLQSSNENLNQTLEKLHRVNKDLETFVYTASHDMKAPISNIEGLINNLEDELTQDCKNLDDVKEMFHMLKSSTTKFKSIINELAIIGKMQEEEDGISEISFKEILDDVKSILNSQIRESHAVFSEDFTKVKSIKFSKKNMRSILHNLISNAIKYRHPDRNPVIHISTYKAGEYILLKVSDNGLGIKEEDKQKIFDMYKRIHQHVEGTGVGMSILARIVDNNGGKIEIDSQPGYGSTFNIYMKK